MLRFKQFIRLLEAQIDDYKDVEQQISTDHDSAAQFHTSKEIIDHFHSFNKSGNVNNTKWIVDQYKKGSIKQEDAPRMGELLDQFEKRKTRLSKQKLSQYQSAGELESALNTTKNDNDFFAMSPEQHAVADAGSTTIYASPNLSIHHIHSTPASIAHGDKMPWCTSRTDKQNMFNHYYQKTGDRVYIGKLPHEEYPYRKIIIGVGANEFQDEKNVRIQGDRLKDFISRNPELKEVEPLQGSVVHITKDPKKHFDDLIQNDQEDLFNHMDNNPGLYDKEHWDLRKQYKDELEKAESGDSSVINSRFRSVLAKLAQKSKDPNVLNHLSQSPHTEVKQFVGANVSTPKETRKSLFGDVSPLVRGVINLSEFSPEEKINILKNERNPEVLSMHLQKEFNRDVNHKVVSHHLPKLQEFISKAIANGDHLQHWFIPALDHGIKYGYVTPDHYKKMGNLLLDKIKKGIHTSNDIEHAENYGYLRMGEEFNEKRNSYELRDHHKALSNDFDKKIDSGTHTSFDVRLAKKYGYWNGDLADPESHASKLIPYNIENARKLSDKLDSGTHTDDDIDDAKIYGYWNGDLTNPESHASKLIPYNIENARKLHDRIDQYGTNTVKEINAAKEHGYWNGDLSDPESHASHLAKKFHDRIEVLGTNLFDNDINAAKEHGYWNGDLSDPESHASHLAKKLHDRIESMGTNILDNDINAAKEHGYWNGDLTDPESHSSHLAKKLHKQIDNYGTNNVKEINAAKAHGYWKGDLADPESHASHLAKKLHKQIDNYGANDDDINAAKAHGYWKGDLADPESHASHLAKKLHDKIDQYGTNIFDDDIAAAKAHGYWKGDLTDPESHASHLAKKLHDKIESMGTNIFDDVINTAKAHGYWKGDLADPESHASHLAKKLHDKIEHLSSGLLARSIAHAKEHGYYDPKLHFVAGY